MPTTVTMSDRPGGAAALPGALLEQIVDIERGLRDNDPGAYYERYSPTALLVFPQVGRIDRDQAVAAIRQENADGRSWAEVAISDVDGRWLVERTVALVTYLVRARWNYEREPSGYLCSTVYVRDQGTWRVGLHQQTPA